MRHIKRLFLALLLTVAVLAAPVAQAQGPTTYVVQAGDTLGAIAARYGTTVAALASLNGLTNPNLIYVGQRLALPGSTSADEPAAPDAPPADAAARPAPFARVTLSNPRPEQGQTVEVNVTLTRPAQVSGVFRDQTLHFSQTEDGAWWGLLAIGMPHAQAGVGLDTPGGDYPLRLTAQADDGTEANVELTVSVREGQYPPTVFDPGPDLLPLLDPELRAAEATRLQAMFKQGTSEPLWRARFVPPINTRVTGGFQVARIIPDGSLIFHEGLDYATAYGSPARATAHGVVALAEPLTVRGNTIYIDHGMGVFSGYFHLSQILVEPGQEVALGQIIGRVGSTGLSTGPHLHFEIRLNGYNVSPSQWLQSVFP